MTYKSILLAAVLSFEVGLVIVAENAEREVLHIRLHLSILEFTTDESLGIEYAERNGRSGS